MSRVKEPHHFLPETVWRAWCGPEDQDSTSDYVPDPADYEALFDEAAPGQLCGESSVFTYLYPELIPVIQERLPDVRIVALLRDPVQRAFSNHLHLLRDGREPLPRFADALDAEQERLAAGWRPFWGYLEQGRYGHHLAPWLEAFGDRMHVMSLEALRDDPVAQMQELFRFLDIDDTVEPDTRARYNITGHARNRTLRRWLRSKRPLGGLTRYLLPHNTRRWIAYKLQRLNTTYPEIEAADRDRLVAALRPDTERLEAMLGRSMPWSTSGGRA